MARARTRWSLCTAIGASLLAAAAAGLGGGPAAGAAGSGVAVGAPLLQQVSSGAVTNKSGTAIQNVSQVETDTFSWGSTVVSAFQAGRTNKGFGAAAIGFATSTDDGRTWVHGLLPGLTKSSPQPNAAYPLVVNQSVAYDAAHGTWLIPTVTYAAVGTTWHEVALMVNTSTNGVTWKKATTAVPTNVDKAWGVCDNTASSPHYGRCYVAYSQLDSSYDFAVVHSDDGGVTWSAPVNVPDGAGGLAIGYNVNPVVQPNGNVVIVATDIKNGVTGSLLLAFGSQDGGATWSVPTTITKSRLHTVPKLRAFNKPTADVDAAGTVTVAFADCRFEAPCTANDLLLSHSADGVHWSTPAKVAISAPVADKFDPGLAVAPGTAGATAQLSLVYYTTETCATSPCLDAEYVTSYDGGATWSTPYALNSTPMPYTWFPNSPRGRMVGDYNSVSFVDGGAVTVMPLATAAPTPYAVTEWGLALPVGFNG